MRSLSTAILAQIAAATAIPRTLFRLHLDGGVLYYTDHTSDIVFQGNTYASRRISHSAVNTFLENKVDNCTVKMDNVDQALSAYFAYEDFEGRMAEIWKVFLDDVLDVIDGTKNLLTAPKLFSDASWTKTHVTLAGSKADPFGGTEAFLVTEDGALGDHQISVSFTGTAAAYTFSIYAKKSARHWLLLRLDTGAAAGVWFDLNSGVVGTQSAGCTGAIADAGGGWYRCSVTRTLTAATWYAAAEAALVDGGTSYSGFFVDCLYLFAAQLELGDHATPFAMSTDDNKIVQFRGLMDLPEVNEDAMSVQVRNMFDQTEAESPWRIFSERCNWRFCETDCAYRGALGALTGTATGGTVSTLIDTAIPSDAYNVNDYWKGARLKVMTGSSAGSVRLISGYTAATKTFAVYDNFPVAIAAGDEYVIECDKNRATCRGFSNEAHFGGFDEQLYYDPADYIKINGLGPGKADIRATGTAIPLIYGRASIPGVLLDEQITYAGWLGWKGDRIYAIGEGEISSVESFSVNGVTIWNNGASLYRTCYVGGIGPGFDMSYNPYLGAAGQSFTFHGDTKYYPRTAVAQIELLFWYGDASWTAQGYNLKNDVTQRQSFLDMDPRQDKVVFNVKGLKVQKYNADGTTDGAPAWSDNPAWCLLDFLLNRSSKPRSLTDIEFASWHTAATVCDTLGYRLRLILSETQKDADIEDLMLAACRGYFTYASGLMELNIEQAWSGDPAHSFDDASAGKTADNIVRGSFRYFKKEASDVFNQVTVTYVDEEIRQSMALVSGYLLAAETTIPYSDLQGAFASSGTIYIAGESITYTGNTGSSLTGCSARTKDYASGYPLFQGAQTFPEMTSVWNDYEHQKKHGIIPHDLNGRAIPTYRQAYAIAEWFGRKAVYGNQAAELRGMIDSLVLSVGDVVKLTHALPGWVDQLFRVTEASEREDDEVDYLLEFYDPSFYADNEVVPPSRIATTLPNPYAQLGNVDTLALAEDGYVTADGTYIPTLLLTYQLPANGIFWGKALIQVKVGAGAYVDYGMDETNGAGFVIDGIAAKFGPGDTVTVRVVSVNVNGTPSDVPTSPTVSKTLTGTVVDPATPTGLALEGGGTSWNGLKFAVVWDAPAAGADPSYIFSEVEVHTGGTLRATFSPIKENRWEYVFGDGFAAALDSFVVAANGAVTIKVKKSNVYGSSSAQATLSITQAAPANPQNAVIQALPRGAQLTWDKNQESDLKEYQVRTKVTSGGTWSSWAPIQDNTFARMLTATEIGTYGKTPTVYFEVKTVDLFGNASTATAANVDAIYYGITNLDVDDISADKITAGSIRGINVQAGSFMTKGSYLTSAPAGGATTLDVKDTTDFPSSGSGWIIDTTNDRDAFSWTGKTASTLTGCSGVLAHNNGATILPGVKLIVIDSSVNEMRFFGDQGDGTILELANIGISPYGSDTAIMQIGNNTSGNSRYGIVAGGRDKAAIMATSVSDFAIWAQSGRGGGLFGSGTAPITIIPSNSSSAPTHNADNGTLWVTSAGVLYINTSIGAGGLGHGFGTTWAKVGAQ